jgi:hypothetical protein
MKLILSVGVGVLMAGLLIWWIADPDGFRHKVWGYSQAEKDEAWQKVQNTQDEVKHDLDAQILASNIRIVELRYGEAAAATYKLCHTYPPTTKQHRLECKKLDDRLARDEARDTKKKLW